MAKCILKCDDFVDKEIEIDGHRNFIEAVRGTHELKENASSVSFDSDGYVIVWYDFSEYVDGVGIYLSGKVMSVNNLKLSMVEYIKFHMLINNLEQTELAEKAGTSQSMVSKVTKGKAGIGATIELYLYCGGKITGIEESKAELLKSYLGESNAIR